MVHRACAAVPAALQVTIGHSELAALTEEGDDRWCALWRVLCCNVLLCCNLLEQCCNVLLGCNLLEQCCNVLCLCLSDDVLCAL